MLEKYLGDEPLTEADLKKVIRIGTLAGHFVPVLTGSAFKNKGVQPMLDAVVDFLPSPLDIPPTHGTNLARRRGRHPRGRRQGAVRGPGVQDRRRPVRQADVLPRLLGHDQQGRRGLQLRQGEARAPRPHPADARQPARGPRRRLHRRHRRRPRLQGHDHRRHPLRPQRPRDPRAHGVPGAGDPRRHRAEDEERPGQARQGAQVAVRRGPDVPHPHATRRPARPSSRAWASCTSRCWSTACSASSPSRRPSASRRWPTARRSPRRSTRSSTATSSRPAAPASSPSSRSRSSRTPARATSSRTRSAAGASRASTSSPTNQGIQAGARRRRARRLPDGGRQGDASSTASTTTSTRPRWRSRSPARWRSARPPRWPSRSSWSRSCRSRSSRPRSTWATSWATSPAVVAASAAWRPGATRRSSRAHGAAVGDVRVQYRPPFAHPGARDLHDAVRRLPAGAGRHRHRDHQAGPRRVVRPLRSLTTHLHQRHGPGRVVQRRSPGSARRRRQPIRRRIRRSAPP